MYYVMSTFIHVSILYHYTFYLEINYEQNIQSVGKFTESNNHKGNAYYNKWWYVTAVAFVWDVTFIKLVSLQAEWVIHQIKLLLTIWVLW